MADLSHEGKGDLFKDAALEHESQEDRRQLRHGHCRLLPLHQVDSLPEHRAVRHNRPIPDLAHSTARGTARHDLRLDQQHRYHVLSRALLEQFQAVRQLCGPVSGQQSL